MIIQPLPPATAGKVTQSDLTRILSGITITRGEYHGPAGPKDPKNKLPKPKEASEPETTIPSPWQRLGLDADESLAIQSVIGGFTAATEAPTYGSAIRDFVDAGTTIRLRFRKDGYVRREQVSHEGHADHYPIAQRTGSDHDNANYHAEAEFEVAQQVGYINRIQMARTKPEPVKAPEAQSPIKQDDARLTDRVFVVPDMGAMCLDDVGEQDASGMGQWARFAGHRQLSIAMIGAAMRGARSWFTLDIFACHMFALATVPKLAKAIGRNSDSVRAQLVAAYARMARARRQAALDNQDARDMLAIMIGAATEDSPTFERRDLTAILMTGGTVPRQIYLGHTEDVEVGLEALRAPCPMLCAYRHPDAPDAASVLADRRARAPDVVRSQADDAARVVPRKERKTTAAWSSDRDRVADHAEKWEKGKRKVAPKVWAEIEEALYVGRTFKRGEIEAADKKAVESLAQMVLVKRVINGNSISNHAH